MALTAKQEKELVKKLLQRRAIVINRIPFRPDLPVGKIIPVRKYADDTYGIRWFGNYPHLFRLLDWWECRTQREMPLFVRFNRDFMGFAKGDVFPTVKPWSKKGLEDNICLFDFSMHSSESPIGIRRGIPGKFRCLEPATTEDFMERRQMSAERIKKLLQEVARVQRTRRASFRVTKMFTKSEAVKK